MRSFGWRVEEIRSGKEARKQNKLQFYKNKKKRETANRHDRHQQHQEKKNT